MKISNPPMLKVNVPGEPMPVLLGKEDSSCLPILTREESSSIPQPPLYENLEDPSIPRRRSVHKRRNAHGVHRNTIDLRRCKMVGEKNDDRGSVMDSEHGEKIVTGANFVLSERPKDNLNISMGKYAGTVRDNESMEGGNRK